MASFKRSFKRQTRYHKGGSRLLPPLAAMVRQSAMAYFGELGELKKEVENRERYDTEIKTEMKLNGAK